MYIHRTNNLDAFIHMAESLEKKAFEVQKIKEQFIKSPFWMQKIKQVLFPEKNRLIPLAYECVQLFDRVEKMPAIFSPDASKTQSQKCCFQTCLKTAEVVSNVLLHSQDSSVKSKQCDVMRRIAALQYRIEGENGGLDHTSPDASLTNQLCDAALRWKRNYPLLLQKELSLQEIGKLEEASAYSKFSEIVLASIPLQEAFFNWILRDNNEVAQYIQFPATCARLKAAYLATRIGRLDGTMFPIQKLQKDEDSFEKVVSLPFFIQQKMKYLSILDETQMVDLKDWSMTIGQALNIFVNKKSEIGNLEFFQSTGITNWNCHELGSWNSETKSYDRVDLTADQWWEALPILEEISKQELESRCGEEMGDRKFVAFAKSSRTTADMDLDLRHGYFEIAIPTARGTYAIYPFGSFAADFPNSIFELALFLADTRRAKISCPDENFFYSHRQIASHPILLTEDEGIRLLKVLQKELIKARFGHLIFQFGGENCAYWSQKVLNSIGKKMPNFYETDFMVSDSNNPFLKKIFTFFRSVPDSFRPTAIRAVDTILGSGRGIHVIENHRKVYKSLQNNQVRNSYMIYQPGHLHSQIYEGKIKGTISTGNCK